MNYKNYASFLTIFIKGIDGSIFAPAMVDIKFMIRTTMTKMSYAGICSTIGYMSGSFGKRIHTLSCLNQN